MSTVKFRKVPELFPNRKVRTVRTEQLWIQAFEATSELASITMDEIRQAQAADDSLQPVIQALKDQVQPHHSGLCQYPTDTCILLSQWDSLVFKMMSCTRSSTTLIGV